MKTPAKKFVLPSIEEQDKSIESLRSHYEQVSDMMSKHQSPTDYIPGAWSTLQVRYGHGWYMNKSTFTAHRKMTRQQCFKNAATLAIDGAGIYVEGNVLVHGVPIAHAWVVDEDDGYVIDTTIRPHPGILGYYGIPFKTEYLIKTIVKHKVYGLLDYWNTDILRTDSDQKEWRYDL
jgi:hypothetical protein